MDESENLVSKRMMYFRGDRVAIMEANSTKVGTVSESNNERGVYRILIEGEGRDSFVKSDWTILISRGKEFQYVDRLLSLVE